MALQVTAPTKHPKSGVYRVRLTVPEHLRATTERLYGVRRELTQTLGTKDHREAIRLYKPILEVLEAKLRAAEAELSGVFVSLTDREISALCGRWLAREEARSADTIPEPLHVYEEQLDFLRDVLQSLEDPEATEMMSDAEAFLGEDLTWLLASQEATIDRASKRKLAARLTHVRYEHTAALVHRIKSGTWARAAVHSSDFALSPKAPTTGPNATLDALIAGWALDRGWDMEARPMPRNLYDRHRTMERLATFLGHREAQRVLRDDVVRWKAEMHARKLNAATIRNDLSEMSAIWKWGVNNGKVEANPFAGTLPLKPKKRAKEVRGFNDTEARAILEASRSMTGYMRWVPWVLCATGARLNEIAQASAADIETVDGVPVIRIHDDGEGRSLKNEDSRRVVPLHPRLISEGFLAYVQGLPPGSDLWPDMAKDKQFGLRSGTGGRRVRWWLRVKLGMTDPSLHANHSWRHWFIDAARRSLMPREVRSAITGHSEKMDEGDAYGVGMGSLVGVLAAEIAKVRMPL